MMEVSAVGHPPEKKFVSPTQLTNAVRRPKSPRQLAGREARRSGRSPYAGSSLAKEPSGMRESPHEVPSFDEGVVMRRRGRRRAVHDDRSRPALADSLQCSVPKSKDEIQDVLLSARDLAVERAKVAAPVARRGVNGCITVTREHAKVPDEEEVRTCMRNTKAGRQGLQRWVCNAYDLVQKELYIPPPGQEHTETHGVFMDKSSRVTQSTTPTRNTSPKVRKGKSKIRKRKTRRSSLVEGPETVSESPLRPLRGPKGVRFPEAASIENPDDRLERERKAEESSSISTPVSLDDEGRQLLSEESADKEESHGIEGMDEHEDYDDQPRAMRNYRLKMFRNDLSSDRTVPKARLSRALSELSHQDSALHSLEQSLEDAKETLGSTERQLVDARGVSEQQKSAIARLRSEAKKETETLKVRLADETKERSNLQSRVSSLQVETSRLKSALRAAQGEAKRQRDKVREMKRYPGAHALVSTYVMEDDDVKSVNTQESGIEIALRAEIVSLKAELAEARADGLQTDPSSIGSRAEVARLRAQLQSFETELARLRLNASRGLNEAAPALSAMKEKLKEKEEDLMLVRQSLERAKSNESNLRDELEHARAKIVELENGRSASSPEVLAEVEELRRELAVAREEVAAPKSKTDATTDARNDMEVGELRLEVTSLTGKLSKSKRQALYASAERLKERQALESELDQCRKSIVDLRLTVQSMKTQLSGAEANGRQIGRHSPSVEGRSVKRKIDDDLLEDGEIATRGIVKASELAFLREKLDKTKASEEKLMTEVSVMKDLVRIAEASTSEIKAEAQDQIQKREEKEAQLSLELQELERRLKDAERTATQFAESKAAQNEDHSRIERELQSSRIKEKSLQNAVKVLKGNLERVEMRCEDERLLVEEERRLTREVDSKRIEEVERLRKKILARHDSPAKDAVLLDRVRDLEHCLTMAEREAKQKTTNVEGDSRSTDHLSQKARIETAVSKARLATARRAAPSNGTVSTGMSTSSFDSLSSAEMSSPGGQSFRTTPPATPSRRDSRAFSPIVSPALYRAAIVEDDNEDSPGDELDELVNGIPVRGVNVQGLERRLQGSNKQLRDADICRKDITTSSGKMKKGQSRIRSECDDLLCLVDKQADYNGSPTEADWVDDELSFISNDSSRKCGSIEE